MHLANCSLVLFDQYKLNSGPEEAVSLIYQTLAMN